MKGPLAFFASLAAVAALGASTVLPAVRERADLVRRIEERERCPAERDTSLFLGANLLARDLKLAPASGGDPLERLALRWPEKFRQAARTGPDVDLEVAAEDLPELLATVARPTAPTIATLVAEPAHDRRKFRVVLRFKPPAEGFEVR